MKVRNYWGCTYGNVVSVWVEENVLLRGDVIPIHRIMAYDSGNACKGNGVILNWGTDSEEVRKESEKIVEHMRCGAADLYDCCLTRLKKEK